MSCGKRRQARKAHEPQESEPVSIRPRLARPIREMLLAGLGLALIGGPLGLLIAHGMGKEAAASLTWPSVTGRIVKSKMVTGRNSKGSTNVSPKITYTYTIEGVAYSGERARFGESKNHEENLALVQRFPPGTLAPVYYDPTSPKQAVLVRGMTGKNSWTEGGIALVVSGLLLALGSFVRLR